MSKRRKLAKLPKPDIALIHALSHDGRGIADINDKKAFISGGLPGETVQYQITKQRRQYYEADLLSVIHPVAERVTPPCTHFGLCGGCSLQHMGMQQQLTMKQQTLTEQLKSFGKVTPESWLAPLSAATEGYRRKARLGVKYVIKKNKLLVGFREKSSNYLADLQSCEVLHPLIGKRFTELAQLISSLELFQQIPQIEIAVGDNDAALVFRHLAPLPETDKEKLMAFGKTFNFHIYLQPNPPAAIHKIWPEDQVERLSYTLPKYQLEFLFHPIDFTQINLEINRMMVDQAVTLLELSADDTVLDLFCGIGNFSLPIAKHCKNVVGIEGSQEMVERAAANARHNCQQNAEFYVANLIAIPGQNAWSQRKYNKILLDPPRTGALEILPFIANLGAERIVYVSCNPATLARDAGQLVHQHKYRLQEVGIMNMFPHTSHVEAMAVFVKEE